MSLTSYRAAPPRVGVGVVVWWCVCRAGVCAVVRVLLWCVRLGWFGGPGGDRLSRTLRCSIMGAGVFHGRVRDGIGWSLPRHGHQVVRAIRPCSVLGGVDRACVGLVRVCVGECCVYGHG